MCKTTRVQKAILEFKKQDGIPQVYLPLLYDLEEECEIPRSDEYTLEYFQERQNLEQPLCMTANKTSEKEEDE